MRAKFEEALVEAGRTLLFVYVRLHYPSLCRIPDIMLGEDMRKCSNCGWCVHFKENSLKVAEQHTNDGFNN